MEPDIMFDHIAGEVRVTKPFRIRSHDPEKVVHAVAQALLPREAR